MWKDVRGVRGILDLIIQFFFNKGIGCFCGIFFELVM